MDQELEELYEDAPCGYLTLQPDGEICRVNRTLLGWTGYSADEIQGRKRFPALLTVPGALLYETYCAPLLRLRGCIAEVALDILCRDGSPLPVLFSATAKRDAAGGVQQLRVVILNAPKRREYERELLVARTQAEEAAEQLRIERSLALSKLAEQELLLQAVGRMTAGDLETPVTMAAGSSLAVLGEALDRMRQDILGQLRDLRERNSEILHLNVELRHQIEQRSRLIVDSMQYAIDSGSAGESESRPFEALPILPPGMMLARRYRVEALLGQGAMGTVYEVERTSDHRRFAAKVLGVRPDYHAMARFAREAQLLARLQHPNLISIIDVDVTAERMAYIIMELVHGKSLAEFGDRYGDRQFMLPILAQVASALTAVHAAGIVHRDLKPANVLVSLISDGKKAAAKLADFGISRLLEIEHEVPAQTSAERLAITAEHVVTGPSRPSPGPVAAAPPSTQTKPLGVNGFDATLNGQELLKELLNKTDPGFGAGSGSGSGTDPREAASSSAHSTAPDSPNRRSRPSDKLTQAGTLVGTLHYMAPELLAGGNLAQPPSDIFSFGLMAYEVLAGALPFDEPPLLMMEKQRTPVSVRPLDIVCRGLSSPLARLFERCLSLDPATRPTAAELSSALGAGQLASLG